MRWNKSEKTRGGRGEREIDLIIRDRTNRVVWSIGVDCVCVWLTAAFPFAPFSIAVNAEHEKAKKDFITQKKMSDKKNNTRTQADTHMRLLMNAH